MQDAEDARLLQMLNDAQGAAKTRTGRREQRKERKAAKRSSATGGVSQLNVDCDDETVQDIIARAKAKPAVAVAPVAAAAAIAAIPEDEEVDGEGVDNGVDSCVVVGGGALLENEETCCKKKKAVRQISNVQAIISAGC